MRATANYVWSHDQQKAEYDAKRDLIVEYYASLTEDKAAYCASESQPINTEVTVPIQGTDSTTQMTKTEYFSYVLG